MLIHRAHWFWPASHQTKQRQLNLLVHHAKGRELFELFANEHDELLNKPKVKAVWKRGSSGALWSLLSCWSDQHCCAQNRCDCIEWLIPDDKEQNNLCSSLSVILMLQLCDSCVNLRSIMLYLCMMTSTFTLTQDTVAPRDWVSGWDPSKPHQQVPRARPSW